MGFKEWIIPQDKIFFELFAKQSENLAEASKVFSELMINFSKIEEKRKKIKDLEHNGDTIVHDIYYRLNQTLVTPLDHEDISRLTSFYDDVLDYIFATVNRIYLYKIKKPTPTMKEFAKIIAEQVKHINDAMNDIKDLKKEDMEKNCIEIHKLENAADDLLYTEISKLFELKNPIEIIKLKEIYEYLEIITDKCEDVSNVILDIRLKYS
ncbi:DUF47 family protein [Candidatus Micrarchaeota archaeon]|nr:DUF47 family protein [Candidatus Micrarchaeota archaeon]